MKAVHERDLSFRFRAAGVSMSPFIKNGDIITVAPKNKSPISLGDIVAFIHHETGRLVVHRVIKKVESFFIIRGDNTPLEDGLIPLSNVLGKVTSVERDGQKVYLGLGLERRIIAVLSKKSLLISLKQLFSPFVKICRFSFKGKPR